MLVGWQSIETEAGVERLLSAFGGFHDACFREAHIWTETSINEELSMACPGHLDAHLCLLFQRQGRRPSAIELLFDEVISFHLARAPEGYGNEIGDAALFINDSVIYWADDCQWRPGCAWQDERAWIAARRLRWRDASVWTGDQLRYGPVPEK